MIGRARLHEWVHARMTKLLMCSLFPVAVGSVLPGCTSAESVTATIASAQSVTTTTTSKGKDDATDQSGKNQLDARKEDTANTGNWGYAPGNGTDPDDQWSRSRGVLDTTSPGCPFKFC